jgi:hypothetical protein
MIYPYERYIIYRLLRGDTFEEVNKRLMVLCLPLVKRHHFDQAKYLVNKLHCPVGLRLVFNKDSMCPVPKAGVEFLATNNLDTIFAHEVNLKGYLTDEQRCATEGAYDIHKNPFARLAINTLLINKVSPQEISDLITRGHKETYSTAAIAEYAHYFWDCSEKSQNDWGEYIELLGYKERQVIFGALTQPLESIKFLISVPTQVEYAEFLKRSLEIASYKVNYFASINTAEADRQARCWMTAGMASGEKYTKYSRGDSGELFKALLFEIEHTASPVVDVTPEIASSLALTQNSFDAAKKRPAPEPTVNPPEETTRDPNNI